MLKTGFGALLGAHLDHLEEGYCRVALPFRPELSRGDTLIHGGVIAALIDKAGTAAAWSYTDIGDDARGATVGLTVNYLRGADSCDLMAHARVVRRGGSITVIDVEVMNPADDLVAKGPVTYKLTR
ncbi:MAG: PaaI family thioesterase [Pseudomonadota bacterium]